MISGELSDLRGKVAVSCACGMVAYGETAAASEMIHARIYCVWNSPSRSRCRMCF